MKFLLPVLLCSVFLFSFARYEEQVCLYDLKVASAFTPNGDENNDVFKIEWPCEPAILDISIYNNFVELIFTSEHFYFEWNAKNDKGEIMTTGVYRYSLKYSYLGKEYTKDRNIVIMR